MCIKTRLTLWIHEYETKYKMIVSSFVLFLYIKMFIVMAWALREERKLEWKL